MPKWLHISIGISLIVLLLSISTITWLMYIEFRKTEPEVLSLIRDTHTGLNATINNLNRDCSQGKERCGTLADVNQTLHTVRGTFGQIEYAARSFNSNQSTFFAQEEKLYSDADASMNHVSTDTLPNLDKVILGFLPVEDNMVPIETQVKSNLVEFQRTNTDINVYLESQKLAETFNNIYGISGSFNMISSDIATKTHDFLYPAPCIGRACWLKRAYTITRDIGPLIEPFYYGVATFESLR